MGKYKSFIAQTIHYFSRPHEQILRTPLEIPAAWKGEQLAQEENWRVNLGEEEIAELEAAIAVAKATGKPTASLSREDFPLPGLQQKIAAWREEIATGRGFQVIRGVPVERWGEEDASVFFWCFGLHFGDPGGQNPQGDLLGHVRDQGQNKTGRSIRLYRTAQKIAYHCDAADVVGLLCLRTAKHGGLSRLVSSVAVYNAILAQRPDLIDRLYKPFKVDAHGEGGVNYFTLPACRYAGGQLRTFYHSDYFRSVQQYDDVPPFSSLENELLDLYETIANDPAFYLDMELAPGDIQLVSNHTVLHARTDYEDHEEPEKKRHLLRLWISLPTPSSPKQALLTYLSRLQTLGTFVKFRLKAKL